MHKTKYRRPPPVAVRPEPREALRARFREALGPVYDEEEQRLGTAARPGELPRHVFDFPEGVRLIVSRLRLAKDGRILTHFSASVRPGSAFERSFLASASPGMARAVLVLGRLSALYAELAGGVVTTRCMGIAVGGIPHFEVLEP